MAARPALNLLLGAFRAREGCGEFGTVVQAALRPYAAVPSSMDGAGHQGELNAGDGTYDAPVPSIIEHQAYDLGLFPCDDDLLGHARRLPPKNLSTGDAQPRAEIISVEAIRPGRGSPQTSP